MKLFILFFIGTLVLSIGGLYEHELQHQQIYNNYGIESKIHVGLTSFYVKAINATEAREKCNESCILSQEINDSVGYNVHIISAILMVGFTFIIALMESRYDSE